MLYQPALSEVSARVPTFNLPERALGISHYLAPSLTLISVDSINALTTEVVTLSPTSLKGNARGRELLVNEQ